MKNIKLLSASLALLAGLASTATCATNGVVLGQNVQSVIDASAPGDTLIVQPGVYPDANLVFNKPLTVLPSGTNGSPMQFMGSIQVIGAGASSFQRAYFASSVQTTGSMVSFFDSRFNGPVTVTGGKVTMKRTILNSPLSLSSNAALEALRMTNNATTTATATAGSGTSFLAVQSSFSDSVALSGYKVWLGYNNFTNVDITKTSELSQTNCDSVLVGNKFFAYYSLYVAYITYAVVYSQAGTLKAYNNLLAPSASVNTTTSYGIWLNSSSAEIVNNTVVTSAVGGDARLATLRGIYASGGGGPVTVRGGLFSVLNTCGCNNFDGASVAAVGGAGQTLYLSYCDSWLTGSGSSLLGVIPPPVNLIEVNPNLAADGSPNPGSPCINAGPPDAIYNNRDGTRNTMGYTGGPYWNPANYTNDNPMVFLLTGQQTVLSGVQTNIQVNAAASSGH